MFIYASFPEYLNKLQSFIEDKFINNFSPWPLLLVYGVLLFYVLWSLYSVAVHEGGIHYVNTETRALDMDVGYNPFKFEVNLQVASYSGLECTFSCEKDCYVLPVWGVPVYELFGFLHKTWAAMKYSITTVQSDKFSGKCQAASDLVFLRAGESKKVVFMPQRDLDLSPNESNIRQSYPFVSIMVLRNADDFENQMAVAMATIVHVPDTTGDLPAKIFGQYVKSSSGKVALLQKVFLSSFQNENVNGVDVALCLACCHRLISCVIVPCGHACVCTTCLKLCKSCPVCRGSVYSYFRLSLRLSLSTLPQE